MFKYKWNGENLRNINYHLRHAHNLFVMVKTKHVAKGQNGNIHKKNLNKNP